MDSKTITAVLEALERNCMAAFYVPTAAEAAEKVASLLHDGARVACGGSMTLAECGVMDLLRSGRYAFIDRDKATTPEQRRQLMVDALSADTYLCSANAITMNGELFNVDGNGNRIAALTFGPRSVIVVAGCNKLVEDVPAAVERVRRVAAPKNAARLSCDTYCAKVGHCVALDAPMGQGCGSDGRICADFLLTGRQLQQGRIKVILVGEPLGY